MKKSKYYHFLKVNENVVAVFNSLILDVNYIDNEEFELLNQERFELIDKRKILEYVNKGILITDESTDDKVYSLLYNHYIEDCRKLDFMYLVLAQGCNLGCKYCFLEHMNANWKNQKMSFEVAKTSIDKLVAHMKRHNLSECSVMLFGGEPLINWELFTQIIEYTKKQYPYLFRKNSKQKLFFRTVTNGTLITKEKAIYFKKHNIIPAISLDGPKNINDKNRIFKAGNRSVYDSVLKTINILKQNKCEFGLSITLSKEVVDQGNEIIKWIKELDVKNIFFNPLHYNDKTADWQEHYEKSTKFIIESFFELLKNDIINGRPVRQISSFVKRSFYFADCGSAGMHQVTVKPDGEVLVCQCDYNSEINKIGNILTDDLEQMIKSPKTNRWINAVPIV